MVASDDYAQRLSVHLQAEQVAGNLQRVGVALTLYELIKYQTVEHTKSFFATSFNERGEPIKGQAFDEYVGKFDPKYDLQAGLLWLESEDILTSADVEAVNRLRSYRNSLAHESANLILDPDFEVDDSLIEHGRDILEKIARFWARIHIDADPAFDRRVITDADIDLPVVSFFDHIHAIVSSGIGSEPADE